MEDLPPEVVPDNDAGLAQFIGQQGTQWNLMMAASVMAMLPTILLVVLLQKHLVRGLLVTGLGGR